MLRTGSCSPVPWESIISHTGLLPQEQGQRAFAFSPQGTWRPHDICNKHLGAITTSCGDQMPGTVLIP